MEDNDPLIPKTISSATEGKCLCHQHPSQIDQNNVVAQRVSRFEKAPLFSSSLIQGTDLQPFYSYGRRKDPTVIALDPGSSGPGSCSPLRCTALFLGKTVRSDGTSLYLGV